MIATPSKSCQCVVSDWKISVSATNANAPTTAP